VLGGGGHEQQQPGARAQAADQRRAAVELELTLILPVATTSVERIFSAMSITKTGLRSKMGDEWLSDLMICYLL
jgi:hypothetical protein